MNEESGAVAVAGWVLKTGHGTVFVQEKPDCQIDFWKPVYDAPPSSQAIETAVYMRAAEVVKKRHGPYHEILALIPQDGYTQLQDLMMQVAKAATFIDGYYLRDDDELLAIVANLIGGPPLSSETKGEKSE